jgi:hypothetical protein
MWAWWQALFLRVAIAKNTPVVLSADEQQAVSELRLRVSKRVGG